MRRVATGIAVSCLVLVGSAAPADAKPLPLAFCDPSVATFTLGGNAFFPLPVGRIWDLRGKEDGEPVSRRTTVLDETDELQFGSRTVVTRVVEELEWEDADGDGVEDAGEARIERSLNYFATTSLLRTVCYFGEAVDNYVDGVVDNHDGSWRADDEGAAPGIYMPAVPLRGMRVQQEYAPGVAEDEATIIGRRKVTVPAGTFRDTVRVRERNPLDASKGEKVYARGVGLVLDESLELHGYSG